MRRRANETSALERVSRRLAERSVLVPLLALATIKIWFTINQRNVSSVHGHVADVYFFHALGFQLRLVGRYYVKLPVRRPGSS